MPRPSVLRSLRSPLVFCSIVGTCLLTLGPACGGGSTTEARGPTATDAPPVAADLSFGFASHGDGATATAASEYVKEALVRAGYGIDDSDRAGRDATFEVRVEAVEQQSLIKMNVNGKELVSYDFTVTLAVSAEGRTGDQHSVRFSGGDGEIDQQALDLLVPQLNASKRFTRFCESARAARSTRVAQAKEEAEAAGRATDEKAWAAAGDVRCANPADLDACDGVKAYLVDHPDGRHAEEARAVLDGARPKLERIQEDENAWSKAQPKVCRRSPSRETCADVEVYKIKFASGGRHLAEAEELLRLVEAKP